MSEELDPIGLAIVIVSQMFCLLAILFILSWLLQVLHLGILGCNSIPNALDTVLSSFIEKTKYS